MVEAWRVVVTDAFRDQVLDLGVALAVEFTAEQEAAVVDRFRFGWGQLDVVPDSGGRARAVVGSLDGGRVWFVVVGWLAGSGVVEVVGVRVVGLGPG